MACVKGYASKRRKNGGRRARPRFDKPLWLPHIEPMTIALAGDVEDFLKEQVRAGICSDASELVNDVIRSVRDQRQPSFEVTPELEAWLLESADKPATPLTKADFDRIRERARERRRPAASISLTGRFAALLQVFCAKNF